MERYLLKIKTKYNFIELLVDDISTPEMKELLEQPYVEEVYIQSTNHYEEGELKYVRKQNTKGNINLFEKE